jgi:hypothetical protein
MTGLATPPGGFRLLCVSIRQDYYLHGNTSWHPVDNTNVPAGVGTRFASLDEIERWVPQALRGVDSYWQVRVIDDTGTVVRLGFRAGYNGTGSTWTWRPPTSPPSTQEATA